MEGFCKVLATTTIFVNAAAVSAAIPVGVDIYCRVPTIATVLADAIAISAAIAELSLLLQALPLPLPLPSCEGLLQSGRPHHHICQCHCHQWRCHIYMRWQSHCCHHRCVDTAAVMPPSPLCYILLQWLKCKKSMLYIFISFCLWLIIILHYDNNERTV